MKIAIGSDERTHLTDTVIQEVKNRDHDIILYGPLIDNEEYWPRVAQQVAESVAAGSVTEGILFCWTGTGVSLAANKVPGIRAALCVDAETARGARLWNDANVLCLSLRGTPEEIAKEILEAWFGTQYRPNDIDDKCLGQLKEIENKYKRGVRAV
jgi:ribose 5-phosphate isomerase B